MWSPEARAAALEARRANAAARKPEQRPKQTSGAKKRGPQTKAHPNPGNRVAFALRNKMIHDAGKDARMAAAAGRAPYSITRTGSHSVSINSIPRSGGLASKAGAGLLGMMLGVGGAILKNGMANTRGGRR
jgi:hypothetical protein